MINYILPFLLFTIALSFKDIFIKQSLIIGGNIGYTMMSMGVVFCLSAILFTLFFKKNDLRLNEKISFSRFVANIIANISMIIAINYLDASTINILNKSTIPLIIVLGGIFGFVYNLKEKIISYVLIISVIIYSLYLINFLSYSELGVIIFSISLVAVCVEFLFLAKASKNGTIMDMILSPSLALMLGGLATVLFVETSNNDTYEVSAFLFAGLSGVALFFAYSSSPMRYKLLPPGLADSPTIIAFIFIYSFEVISGTKEFNIYDVVFSGIIILFSVWLVFSKIKKQGQW